MSGIVRADLKPLRPLLEEILVVLLFPLGKVAAAYEIVPHREGSREITEDRFDLAIGDAETLAAEVRDPDPAPRND